MQKIGQGLAELFASLGGSDADRIARRTAVVHVRWKTAIKSVYQNAAQLVLDHVNSVVIMDDAGARTLIVYSDDSLIRSDLDSRQEFIKMKLKEQGEVIDVFKILPSKFDMKARHPFMQTEYDRQEEAMLKGSTAHKKTSAPENTCQPQTTRLSRNDENSKSFTTPLRSLPDETVSEDEWTSEDAALWEKRAEEMNNTAVGAALAKAIRADFEAKKIK